MLHVEWIVDELWVIFLFFLNKYVYSTHSSCSDIIYNLLSRAFEFDGLPTKEWILNVEYQCARLLLWNDSNWTQWLYLYLNWLVARCTYLYFMIMIVEDFLNYFRSCLMFSQDKKNSIGIELNGMKSICLRSQWFSPFVVCILSLRKKTGEYVNWHQWTVFSAHIDMHTHT